MVVQISNVKLGSGTRRAYDFLDSDHAEIMNNIIMFDSMTCVSDCQKKMCVAFLKARCGLAETALFLIC
jgi:hypothetical protein